MAQRRMFSKAIVKSEEFSVMPKSSQALYFHLGMEADDDGFIHPGQVMRSGGYQADDLKILLAKRFLLTFESGVVVIKHWLIHNLIQKDRHTKTRYEEELSTLFVKGNKAYTDNLPINLGHVNKVLPQVRLGQVRLDKDNLLEREPSFEIFWEQYPRKEGKSNAKKSWLKLPLTGELITRIMSALEQHKSTEQWQRENGRFIPYPASWLNQQRWEDEISESPSKILDLSK